MNVLDILANNLTVIVAIIAFLAGLAVCGIIKFSKKFMRKNIIYLISAIVLIIILFSITLAVKIDEIPLAIGIIGHAFAGSAVILAAWLAIKAEYSPKNIKTKTKEQTLQKMKMDNIMNIIKYTKELSEAINGITAHVVLLSRIIAGVYANGYNNPVFPVTGMHSKLKQEIKNTNNLDEAVIIADNSVADIFNRDILPKLNSFISFLKISESIGGEDQRVKEIIEEINKFPAMLPEFFQPLANMSNAKQMSHFQKYSQGNLQVETNKKVDEIIQKIVDVYKEKLESETE